HPLATAPSNHALPRPPRRPLAFHFLIRGLRPIASASVFFRFRFRCSKVAYFARANLDRSRRAGSAGFGGGARPPESARLATKAPATATTRCPAGTLSDGCVRPKL